MSSRTRKIKTNYLQFTLIVEFMEKNGDLFSPQKLAQRRPWCCKKWKELTALLNSLSRVGQSRSEMKWRKVWTSLKVHTKKKWAKVNKSTEIAGGDPASKMTFLENRVLRIMNVQVASGMLTEGSFGQMESTELKTERLVSPTLSDMTSENNNVVPTGDEDTSCSSKDPVPVFLVRSPVVDIPSRLNSSPPREPTPQPPTHPQHEHSIEEYFSSYDENSREDSKHSESIYIELEKERIRQRDVELRQKDQELQLQAEWLELAKGALNVFNKYLDKR